MNEQLDNLTVLWTHEQARDALLADYKSLKDKVSQLTQEVETRGALQSAAEAAREALKVQEHELNRRLDAATKRLTRTQKLIDMGQVTDYGIAKTQVAQNEGIIDEVETSLLEIYEATEAADAALSTATNQAALTRTRLAEAQVKLERRTPEIRAALNEVTPLRDAARELLGHHSLSRYDLLRQRRSAVMADIMKGACTGCHVKLNVTQFMEFRRDLGVQICTNCGRFLRSELDS